MLKHCIYIYAMPHSQRLKNQSATIWQPLVTKQKCVFPDWMQVVTDSHYEMIVKTIFMQN